MMKKVLFAISAILMALSTNAQTCPDDNHPHAIDLGLPSGTKWACCNVGADTPEGYGGYYAWGETEEKTVYSWNTYIHCDGHSYNCHDLGSDIAGTQYDVAHVKWGGLWQMPSQEQTKEFCENCTFSWTSKNGIDGGLFTGPNGGTIFLPAAGSRWNDELYNVTYLCHCWSSTLDPSESIYAYGLDFMSDNNVFWNYYYYRYDGFTVRPIIRVTTNIKITESSSNISSQPIYNLYGIKVADNTADMNTLSPGIYIVNGKKMVIK